MSSRRLAIVASVAIGVASVVILVALGEGARQYVLGEFSFIGKDTLVIFPGRKTTTGAMPPISGASARDITLQEQAADALRANEGQQRALFAPC